MNGMAMGKVPAAIIALQSVGLVGATVTGYLAARRRDEIKALNDQLRNINAELRSRENALLEKDAVISYVEKRADANGAGDDELIKNISSIHILHLAHHETQMLCAHKGGHVIVVVITKQHVFLMAIITIIIIIIINLVVITILSSIIITIPYSMDPEEQKVYALIDEGNSDIGKGNESEGIEKLSLALLTADKLQNKRFSVNARRALAGGYQVGFDVMGHLQSSKSR